MSLNGHSFCPHLFLLSQWLMQSKYNKYDILYMQAAHLQAINQLYFKSFSLLKFWLKVICILIISFVSYLYMQSYMQQRIFPLVEAWIKDEEITVMQTKHFSIYLRWKNILAHWKLPFTLLPSNNLCPILLSKFFEDSNILVVCIMMNYFLLTIAAIYILHKLHCLFNNWH